MTNQGLEIQTKVIDMPDDLAMDMLTQELEGEAASSADLHLVSCVSPTPSSPSSSSRFISTSHLTSTTLDTSSPSSKQMDQNKFVKTVPNLRARRLIESKRTCGNALGNDVRNQEKDGIHDDISDRRNEIVVEIPSLVSSPIRKPAIAKMRLPPLLILSPINKLNSCDTVQAPRIQSCQRLPSPVWAPSSSSSSSLLSSLSSGSDIDVGEQPIDIIQQVDKKKQQRSPDKVDFASSRNQSFGKVSSLDSPIKKNNRLFSSMPSPMAMYGSMDSQNKLPPIQFSGGGSDGDCDVQDIFQIDSYNALQMCMSPQNNENGFLDIRIPKFRFSSDNPFASRKSVRKRNALAADRKAGGNAIVPFRVSNYNGDFDTIRLKYVGSNKNNRRKSF